MSKAKQILTMQENLRATGYSLAMIDLCDAMEEIEMKYGKDCPLIGEIKFDIAELMGEKQEIRKVNAFNATQSDFGE